MIGIYKIENLINHKKYIGQSIDIIDRWRDHKWVANSQYAIDYPLYRAIRKYGLNNFDFSIIEECGIDELNEREIYWIDYYKTFVGREDNNGYNLTLGGAGNRRLPQEYIEWFKDLWRKGLSTGEIATITGKDKHIVIQYLKWYEPSYSIDDSKKRGSTNSGINHRKKIIQCDFLGRELQRFNSIKEAVQKTGYTQDGIRHTLKCQTKGTHMYYFVYDDENITQNLTTLINIPYSKRGFCPIIQVDSEDNFINYFLTLKDAAKSVGCAETLIGTCARGKYLTAYKYKWYFITTDLIEKYNLKERIPIEQREI